MQLLVHKLKAKTALDNAKLAVNLDALKKAYEEASANAAKRQLLL